MATALGYGATNLGVLLVPPLLPAIIRDLSITPLEAGVAVSVLWATIALVQYPVGRLSDRLNRKTFLVTGILLTIVGIVSIVSSVNYLTFIMGTMTLGLGSGVFSISSMAYVSELFASRRGQAIGVLTASADLSGVVAGVIVGLFAVAAWETTFAVVAVVLFPAVLMIHSWNEQTYRLEWTTFPLRPAMKRLLGNRYRRRLLVVLLLWMFVVQATINFLPLYVTLTKQLAPWISGVVYATMWLVGVLAKPVTGKLGDTVGHRPVGVILFGVAGVGLGALTVVQGIPQVLGASIVLALGLLGAAPVVYAHVMDITPHNSIGADLGILRTVMFGVGSLGPLAFGSIGEIAGFDTAALVMAVLIWFGGVLFLVNAEGVNFD